MWMGTQSVHLLTVVALIGAAVTMQASLIIVTNTGHGAQLKAAPRGYQDQY